MRELISLDIQDHILCIKINRPEKRNALTLDMYSQLSLAFADADADPDIRVVILTGGEGAFSSGNDIVDFVAAGQGEESVKPPRDFLQQIAAFEKPIVAAVNGVAVGIGTTMLLHCDLIYASDNARFQLPFVNLGLVPEGGSSLLLPLLVGHQKASELLLLGEPFDAQQAAAMGLVNRVVEPQALEGLAREQALKLAAKPVAALLASKQLLKSQQGKSVSQVIDQEIALFAKHLQSKDAIEALSGFLKRR